MKKILRLDSQFSRFFLGICSAVKKFEELLDWLNPTFDDAEMIQYSSLDPNLLLSVLSACLSDCSETEAQLLGQRLAASLEQLEEKIKTERNSRINLWRIDLSSLNNSFQSGLNLNFLDKNTYFSWSLSHVGKPKRSRLTHVFFDLPILPDKFDKFEIFILIWNTLDEAKMISSLDRLPSVSTLIVYVGSPQFEVNFAIIYEKTTTMTTTSAATQLRHFTFGFHAHGIPSLKYLLTGQPDTNDFIIGEIRKTGDMAEISWLTVTVAQSLDQTRLARILMSLAVKCVDHFL